jgi:transposase
VWERLHRLVQEQRGLELGMVFLDGTVIRAHQKAAGARKQGRTPAASAAAQALGRSRGGFSTKSHVLADAGGRAIAFALTPGQAAELPQAEGLLGFLPGTPIWTVADRGYSSHALRETIRELGSTPAIPTRKNETPVACRAWVYVHRERVERLWSRLKEWRAVATRYEDRSILSRRLEPRCHVRLDQMLTRPRVLGDEGSDDRGSVPRHTVGKQRQDVGRHVLDRGVKVGGGHETRRHAGVHLERRR